MHPSDSACAWRLGSIPSLNAPPDPPCAVALRGCGSHVGGPAGGGGAFCCGSGRGGLPCGACCGSGRGGSVWRLRRFGPRCRPCWAARNTRCAAWPPPRGGARQCRPCCGPRSTRRAAWAPEAAPRPDRPGQSGPTAGPCRRGPTPPFARPSPRSRPAPSRAPRHERNAAAPHAQWAAWPACPERRPSALAEQGAPSRTRGAPPPTARARLRRTAPTPCELRAPA